MYALYNKEKSAFLEHPVVGLWLSPDIKEARSMQQAAQTYLLDLKLDHLVDRIVVIDYATKKEVTPMEALPLSPDLPV